MNKAWEILRTTQLRDGFGFAHHPTDALQLTILDRKKEERKKFKVIQFEKYLIDDNFAKGRNHMNFGSSIWLHLFAVYHLFYLWSVLLAQNQLGNFY